jgi:hypothetical protein
MTMLRIVASRLCRCGRKKGQGTAFCYSCWRTLSVGVQRRVYPVGGILDPAGYAAACRVLDLNPRRKEVHDRKEEADHHPGGSNRHVHAARPQGRSSETCNQNRAETVTSTCVELEAS